jgi:hypothetical protein
MFDESITQKSSSPARMNGCRRIRYNATQRHNTATQRNATQRNDTTLQRKRNDTTLQRNATAALIAPECAQPAVAYRSIAPLRRCSAAP